MKADLEATGFPTVSLESLEDEAKEAEVVFPVERV